MKLNTEIIKLAMERQGLSVLDLSRRVRRHSQWVYDILAGNAGKTFRTAEILGEALGIPPKDLIEDMETGRED